MVRGGGAGGRKWGRRDDGEGSRDPFGKSNSGHLAGSQPATSLTQLCGLLCSDFNSSWVFWYYNCVPCRPLPVAVAYPARYSEYSGVCYNEQFLSIKSGCYSEHRCYKERGGILSADVARACAWRVRLPALNRASFIISVMVWRFSYQFSSVICLFVQCIKVK